MNDDYPGNVLFMKLDRYFYPISDSNNSEWYDSDYNNVHGNVVATGHKGDTYWDFTNIIYEEQDLCMMNNLKLEVNSQIAGDELELYDAVEHLDKFHNTNEAISIRDKIQMDLIEQDRKNKQFDKIVGMCNYYVIHNKLFMSSNIFDDNEEICVKQGSILYSCVQGEAPFIPFPWLSNLPSICIILFLALIIIVTAHMPLMNIITGFCNAT